MLDQAQLGELILGYRAHRFRMETLPLYAVTTDRDDYNRWLRGEPDPDSAGKRPWLDQLRAEAAAGRRNTRVRVLSEDLTEYERYECEWGYVHTGAAGEDIRVLRHGEHDVPAALTDRDWWLVDDATVIAMHYADDGRFEGGEHLPSAAVEAYRDARAAAWAVAEPFARWWARHPELHRAVAA